VQQGGQQNTLNKVAETKQSTGKLKKKKFSSLTATTESLSCFLGHILLINQHTPQNFISPYIESSNTLCYMTLCQTKSLIKERTAVFGCVLGKRYGTALQPSGSTR